LSTLKIQGSKVLDKILKAKDNRIIVLEGGSRSSKTWSIFQYFIILALSQKGLTFRIAREKFTWVKETLLKDWQDIIAAYNLPVSPSVNKNRPDQTYELNGNYFIFIGLDDPQKLHGLKQDYFWINEAIEATVKDFDQLEMRTNIQGILDYNPSVTDHWIYDKVIPREDAHFIHSTMLDNPFLPEQIRKKILSYEPTAFNKARGTADETSWKIYGLGVRAQIKGVILTNWRIVEDMPECKWIAYGQDYGFTNDPTTLIRIGFAHGEIWLQELIYETDLTNQDIVAKYKAFGIGEHEEIIADSAEPKSNEEIKRRGYNIKPAVKGPDSIVAGIDLLKQYRLNITSSSLNIIREIKNYKWKYDDKTDTHLNVPIDSFNHCFTGDTLISTINGEIPIKDIKEGDLVLTTGGYEKVLKKFDNGVKKVSKVWMQYGTKLVYLDCTEDHLIKTTNGWKKIKELQATDQIYHIKTSTERDIGFIKTKDIILEDAEECMRLSGNLAMGKDQKDITSTIKMGTPTTTTLKTFPSLEQVCTIGLKAKKDIKKTQNTVKSFTRLVLKRQKNGMQAKRVENGILNTGNEHGLIESIKPLSVKFVERAISQDTLPDQSIAIKIARLKLLERGESRSERVYDLMVENNHEYFANGILVHNCIDAIRYCCSIKLKKQVEFFSL